MRKLFSTVAVIALLGFAAQAELDADLCQVRATAVCGRRGCAFGRGSWSPAAGCQVKCADCESRRDRHAVLYTRAEFSTANCSSGLESISAGWAGKCQRDNSFVSCTKDTCSTHRFAEAHCRGRRELMDVAASGVCLPTGSGGSAELWRITTAAAIHPFAGETPCPYKDVHRNECAEAIASCEATCFGGFEPCLECIAQRPGNLKDCCQTMSYYTGFDCSDCNSV